MKAYERCCASSNKFLQHTVVNGWWPISTWDKRVFFAGRMPQSSIAAYCSTSFQLCLFIDATGYRASFSLWWLVCKDLKMTHHSVNSSKAFTLGFKLTTFQDGLHALLCSSHKAQLVATDHPNPWFTCSSSLPHDMTCKWWPEIHTCLVDVAWCCLMSTDINQSSIDRLLWHSRVHALSKPGSKKA